MKKILKINIITLIVFVVVYYCAYYLLLSDNSFNTSISSIMDYSHTLDVYEHLLLLALLPVYIAGVIFGAGILGIFIVKWMKHFFWRPSNKSLKSKLKRLTFPPEK